MQKTLVIFFSIIAVSSSYIVDYGPVVKATKGKYFSKKKLRTDGTFTGY